MAEESGQKSSQDTSKYSVSQDFFIYGVEDMVSKKSIWESEEFSCTHDPDDVKWQLKLRFGTKCRNELTLWLFNRSSDDVIVLNINFNLSSANGEEVESRQLNRPKPLQKLWWGCNFVCKMDELPLTVHYVNNCSRQLKVGCNVVYEATTQHPPQIKLATEDLDFQVNLLSMLKSGDGADVTFVVGSNKIPAIKALLSARSEYFKVMFQSGMREADAKEIYIEGIDPDAFKEMLKYLYCGKLPENFKDIARKLIPVVDQYQVTALKRACEIQLNNAMTSNNVCDAAMIAHTHDCPRLKKNAFDLMLANLKHSKKDEKWTEMLKIPGLAAEVLTHLANKDE